MPEEKNAKSEIESFLTLQNNKVKRNVQIVSASEMKFPVMLHVDVQGRTPKSFYPQMPRRAANSEDNTVARVTVADTLLGCIIAYASLADDFHNRYHDNIVGYDINALDYAYCFKPSDKLVYDAVSTNEHWLVGFNKEHMNYKPVKAGVMFAGEFAYSRRLDKDNKPHSALTKATLCVLVNQELCLSKNKTLKPGHYFIRMGSDEDWSIDRNSTYDEDQYVRVKSITHKEFMEFKKLHAPELSLEHSSVIDKW